MNLRPLRTFRRPRTWRFALLAVLAIALLSFGRVPGDAAAGLSDYSSTLYLSGAASSTPGLGGSYKLATVATPGQPAGAPTPTVAGAGVLTGTYQYEYTVVDPTGGETPAGMASAGQTVTAKSFNINGLPTGVTVRLYRTCSCSSTLYYKIAQLVPGAAAPQFVDNVSDASANVPANLLPLTQNRPTLGAGGIGYYKFVPGSPLTSTSATSTKLPGNPAFSGEGWVVDAPGRVSFPAGNWTFTEKFKGTAGGTTVARLVIGLWIVDDAGAVVGAPLIDPTNAAAENATANIASAAGTASSIPTTIAVGPISLAANQHLYVQFWRHQTVNTTNTTTTLVVNDGVGAITHPTANGFPNVPALGSVAARVNTTPTLSATFSDPDAADTGTLTFQLCSDSGCSSVLQSGSSASGIANSASGTWTPTSLADGTYYWRASATDSAANGSGFSATSSFVVDTVAPTTPSLGSPAAAAHVNSTQLSATFADADAGDTGTVNFQLCSNASCSSVVASGTSATVSGGSTGSWTPAGIVDGTYYWRARNTDAAGNASAWSATRGFTLDTTAPGTPALVAVGSLLTAVPQLSAGFSDPDGPDTGTISFQVCTDSGCASIAQAGTSPGGVANGSNGSWTPPTLADGSYFWRARALDAAGNQSSAWSGVQQFSLDTTAPSTPPLGAVAARTNVTPQLSATFADPDAPDTGTVSFQLCSNSSCSSVLQSATSGAGIANGASPNWTPTTLADGVYYWRAQALDAHGNLSAWSAVASFVVDTVAPNTPALTAPAAAARVNTTQVTATFTDADAGDSGTLSFQLCSDAACSSIVATSTSATISGGSSASWTPAGIADGVYSWRVRAQDAAGNASAWSATRSFTLDTNAPATPALAAPADAAFLATVPTLSATFVDGDAGDSGSVLFQICADSGCSTVVTSGSSVAGLANGATGSWLPSSLAGGDYYWRAAARDAAGNQSPWSAARSFTLDKTPPAVPTLALSSGAARVRAIPSLTATYTDPGSATGGSLFFELCRTSSCSAPVVAGTLGAVPNGTSGSWAPAELADGRYYARVRAEDTAGNQSAWSATSTFILDRTAPSVPTPAALRIVRMRRAPLLGAPVDNPGDPTDDVRMLVEICSDAGCASVVVTGYSSLVQAGSIANWQSPSLPDGTYYWRARAEDSIGNQSAPSSAQQFVVDTVAPNVPETTAPADGAVVKQAVLTGTFQSSDAGDGGTVMFEVCANAACTTVLGRGASSNVAAGVVASGVSTSVGTGATVTWAVTDLPNGSYFWRARAKDEAGNVSDWSATQSFTLDQTPPGKPRGFRATTSGHTLTIRWQPPADTPTIAGYALLVNGRRIVTLDARTLVVRVALQDGEKRSFAIAAIDEAGNVGVPNAAFRPPAQPAVKQTRKTPAPKAPVKRHRRT